MQDPRSGPFCCLILVGLLASSSLAHGSGNVCDISKADVQCGAHERCVISSENTTYCQCERDFQYEGGVCVRIMSPTVIGNSTAAAERNADSSSGGSSVAAGLLIPTFLVAIGVLLYFGARRYKWVQRFRQFRQNRYGNVLVTRDDDDDDVPPIP